MPFQSDMDKVIGEYLKKIDAEPDEKEYQAAGQYLLRYDTSVDKNQIMRRLKDGHLDPAFDRDRNLHDLNWTDDEIEAADEVPYEWFEVQIYPNWSEEGTAAVLLDEDDQPIPMKSIGAKAAVMSMKAVTNAELRGYLTGLKIEPDDVQDNGNGEFSLQFFGEDDPDEDELMHQLKTAGLNPNHPEWLTANDLGHVETGDRDNDMDSLYIDVEFNGVDDAGNLLDEDGQPVRSIKGSVKTDPMPWFEFLTKHFEDLGEEIEGRLQDSYGEVVELTAWEAGIPLRPQYTFHVPGADESDLRNIQRITADEFEHCDDFNLVDGKPVVEAKYDKQNPDEELVTVTIDVNLNY